MANSVWITGIGAVTPLGNGFSEVAENLLAGKSGISSRQLFPDEPAARQFISGVGEIPLPSGWNAANFARLNRLEQLILSCSAEALTDAGLWEQRGELRIGLVLGLGAEHLRVWELDMHAGGDRIGDPSQDIAAATHVVQRELGLQGPVSVTAAACASSGYSMTLARRWVQSGWVDVCLTGGCDLLTPMSYRGFYNLRALSRRSDDPAKASRPFDRDRDGFVMGEGGAMFVLEPEAAARRRLAATYGEFAGVGASSDATHMVIPSSDPQPASRAIRQALADAAVEPGEVDYINAHAAGTPVGDQAETRVMQLAFGDAIRNIPVSSTKSMTGHLISAAAAIEALACLAAIREQAVPPTVNLDNPDPACDLCHVPHQARPQTVRVAASNSLGFGGSNTCLIFRRAA